MFGFISIKKARRIALEAEYAGIQRGVEIGFQVHQSVAAGNHLVYITGRPLDKDIREDIDKIMEKEGL